VVHRCLPGGQRARIYCNPKDNIAKQLAMFADYGGGRFFDCADSFGEDLEHTYGIVLPQYADYPGGWITEAKISVLKGEDGKWQLLKAMAKAGNILTYVGLEDIFRKFTSKQVPITDAEEFIRVCRDEGIIPAGALILVGAPDAQKEDISRTIKWICANKIDVQFSLISALESSALWSKAAKAGTLIDICPENTDGAWSQVDHPNMSAKFLLDSLEKCYRECYSLPEIFSRLRARGFSRYSIIAALAGVGVHISAKTWFKDHNYYYWLDHRILPNPSHL